MSYITGLAGTPGPGYFVDNNGQPKLWVATETWGLLINAGEWTGGGARQLRPETTISCPRGQGRVSPCDDRPGVGGAWGYHASNGNTWDGVTPLAGGSTDRRRRG